MCGFGEPTLIIMYESSSQNVFPCSKRSGGAPVGRLRCWEPSAEVLKDLLQGGGSQERACGGRNAVLNF